MEAQVKERETVLAQLSGNVPHLNMGLTHFERGLCYVLSSLAEKKEKSKAQKKDYRY